MRSILVPALALILVLPFTFPPQAKETAAEGSAESRLVEKAEVRLAQLDVTVRHAGKNAAGLRPADFSLQVGGREIQAFEVDALCTEISSEGAEPAASLGTRTRATCVLYFDQRHLTAGGRSRAFEIARDLVPRLVESGGRVSIVSSASTLVTLASRSSDPAELIAALDKAAADPEQSDAHAIQEDSQVRQLEDEVVKSRDEAWLESYKVKMDAKAEVQHLARVDFDCTAKACKRPLHNATQALRRRTESEKAFVAEKAENRLDAIARAYEVGERNLAHGEVSRLRAVLAGLEGVEPPKALVYFADTMRRNAGEHYVRLVRGDIQDLDHRGGRPEELLDRRRWDLSKADEAESWFDAFVDDAAGSAVRVFAVRPEGMAGLSSRVEDAENALASMALDTGGRSFLGGAVSSDSIARGILDDIGCVYVLSFEPEGLPDDKPLPVHVQVLQPGFETVARSRMTIQSPSARRSSRVLAAFASDVPPQEGSRLSASVIPIGVRGRRFVGLVQTAVTLPQDASLSWDLGATVVSGGRVTSETSSRMTVNAPGTQLVLEEEVLFDGQDFTIVAVAQDLTTQEITSVRIEGAWPRAEIDGSAVGPIAIVQPAAGGFRRGRTTRTRGSLAVPETASVDSDSPAAFVGIVCRGPWLSGVLTIEREIRGERPESFPPIRVGPEDDGCVQVRDLVRATTLGAGDFLYEIRVLKENVEIGRGARRFHAARATAQGAATAPR